MSCFFIVPFPGNMGKRYERYTLFGSICLTLADAITCFFALRTLSCVAAKLQELNSMVTVKVASGELTEEVVGVHSVVVMCGRPGEEVSRWNAFCHERVGSRNEYFCLTV